MENILKFSGIVTKIRAMQARLLTNNNFEEISSFRNVAEAVSYLKQTPGYSRILTDTDENLIHRTEIEKLLTLSLYEDYASLYSFSGLEIRRFLSFYMKRYEIDVINYCARIIFNHYQEPFDLNYKKPFFNKYSQISIDKLLTARTLTDLTETLKDTEYYPSLKRLEQSQDSTLFDYGLALELYYFSAVWKERKKILKKKDLEMFTRVCGARIDLLNLQWIYRAKKYYHMSSVEIYSMLIPIQYHLNNELLKKLVDASSLEDFITLVSGTYYVRKYDFDNTHTIERTYKNCLNHLYTAEKRKYPYSLAAVNSYLFQKEEEIEKLTTALECIRYGLSQKETLEYVGGVMKL